MTEIYENLVREYLELKGYTVMTDLKFEKHRKGKRKGFSDIDIVAYTNTRSPKLIVGEVKSSRPAKKEIERINEHLNKCKKTPQLKIIFGDKAKTAKKYIYSWSQPTDDSKKHFRGEIEFVGFKEIVQFMIEYIAESKIKKGSEWTFLYIPNHPNLMLLQFIRQMLVESKKIDWKI